MNFRKILKKVGSYFLKLYFKKNTKIFEGRLPYLHIKRNSEVLLIVFSGFDTDTNVRKFNFVRQLWKLKCDKLYISDPFGFRGSYYWFENGSDSPEYLTLSLVNQIVAGGGYKRVITAGSSKGGTAAVYFGLKIGADKVFAGACQYYIGNYIKAGTAIFTAMMGQTSDKSASNILNEKLPKLIYSINQPKTAFHLIYSKVEKDRTWQNDMRYLIDDLLRNHFKVIEYEEYFTLHNDIGNYFVKYILQDYLNDSRWKV